jgi:5'-nucleotidase
MVQVMAQSRRVIPLAVLTLGAVVAVSVGVGLTVKARAGDAAPESPFRLSSYSIWAGQSTTLVQSSPAGAIQRIDWGDGSVETVPGAAQVAHVYETVGTFTPTVTVGDEAPRSLGSVTVSTVIGAYEVETSTAWPGEAVTLAYQTYDEADNVKISWGDGTTSVVRASVTRTTASHTYKAAGAFEITAAPANESGTATPRKVGTVTVQKDGSRPTITLTTPSRPALARSWATLTGTAADTGVGLESVALTAVFKRDTTWFAFTSAGWTKVKSAAAATRRARPIVVTPDATGVWRTRFSAPADGTLRITYTAIDKAGNRSVPKAVAQNITG